MALNSRTADPSRNGDETAGADETAPLLGAPEVVVARQGAGLLGKPGSSELGEREEEADRGEVEEKPMPVGQILLLCYASLVEPVAYFSIIPYINEMIHRTGKVPLKDVGFWTGPMEGLFSLVQMMLLISYGRAADRIGRKPVLVFSLAGVSVATALFGCSQNLAQMMLLRCVAGLFGGSVVTTRTMISESCSKAGQARAFSWYMFTRNLGIFIGPLAGGSLANPAELYPGVFGNIAFFRDNPYALASFVAGFICLTATLTSLFGLKETLNRSSGPAKVPLTTWQVLKSPGVPIVLYIFGHVMLLALSYTAAAPVMFFEPIKNGGFSFSNQQIAGFLMVAGISQSAWLLIVFPPLQRRLGSPSVLRICAIAYPFVLVMYPILNEFLRRDWTRAFWIVGVLSLVTGSGIAIAFACVQLCVNNVSPSPEVLATVNALALTVNSGVRTVAPIAATSIYAAGVNLRWADGHLFWILVVLFAAALNIPVWFLPASADDKIEGNAKVVPQQDVDGTNVEDEST